MGTALAATAFYREHLKGLTKDLATLHKHPQANYELWFLGVAALVSGVVGILAYRFLITAFTQFEGAFVVILIGVLLVLTGLLQKLTARTAVDQGTPPSMFDALLS